MNFLIFGGTRFVGKSLVKKLVQNGHEVTVISTKKVNLGKEVKFINQEKQIGIELIENFKIFDFVIDFIAYKPSDVENFFKKIKDTRYLMISTLWINQYLNHNDRNFLDYEINYIKNKIKTENITKLRNDNLNIKSYIFRAPIIIGEGDHTGRSLFYHNRILNDNEPLLFVENNYRNSVFLFKNDFVNIIYQFLTDSSLYDMCSFDILPKQKISIYPDLFFLVYKNLLSEKKILNISENEIKKLFIEFYEKEPYLKESDYDLMNLDLVKLLKYNEKSYDDMMKITFDNTSNEIRVGTYKEKYKNLRDKEIEFIFKYF